MTKPANRWLLISPPLGAMAIGMSACHKTPAATDATSSADTSAATAPPATDTNAMGAENSADTTNNAAQ